MPIEFVRALVEFAKQDARVALLIVERQKENAQFALYHVQQSIEKASKALLLLTGNPKYDMVYLRQTISHNSLKASLEFIRMNAEIEDLKPLVRRSVKADVYERLHKVINESGSRAYFDEFAWLSPHEMDHFLKLPRQFAPDKLLVNMIPEEALTLTRDQMDKDDLLGSLMDVIENHINFTRIKWREKEEVIRPLAQKILDIRGQSYILAALDSMGVLEIDIREIVKELFMFAQLVVRVYVMSALTFPHATISRYPSEPGAKQYNDSVGAIVLGRNLAREAYRIATDILEHFDQIAERIRALHDSYSSEEAPSSC